MTDAVDALVTELSSAGVLPAELSSQFRAVPRELFIPDRVWVGDAYDAIDRADEPKKWLNAVYSNVLIVTQFDDGKTLWPHVGSIPTCSASMPSVVAGMLNCLQVHAGHSVLEIGTGTGYNAALLDELVGQRGSVSSVEVDAQLFESARKRLAKARHSRVNCMLDDGTKGVPGAAPFDRIISTASVYLGRVPYEWVEQTRPGGIILTPVRADLASGPLVRFIVGADGTATGRMIPMGVGFMEVRNQRTASMPRDDIDWEDGTADQKTTTTKPWLMFSDAVSRWTIAVALPTCRYNMDEGHLLTLRDPVSGSWASVTPHGAEQYLVRQQGIRRLWDEAETAYRWWIRQGQPVGTDWQWRITPDHQTVRLAS